MEAAVDQTPLQSDTEDKNKKKDKWQHIKKLVR